MEPDNPPSGDIAAVAEAKLSERKRLKHREYVKKSYKKKLTTLENLRRELEMLDKKYAVMLISGGGSNRQSDEDGSTGAQASNMQKYLQENGRLYQLNAYHMKVESRMGQLIDAYEAAKEPLPGVSTGRQYRIRPMSTAAYTNVVNIAMNDVLRFARSPEKLSTGARVLGWADQREVHGRTLKFALQKEFGLSPLNLLQRSWEIFSNPEEFSKIYGAALDVQFYALQHIDADTKLFFRRITTPADSARVVKTVFLLARRQIKEGYLLLFRSIDKDLVRFEEFDVGGVPDVNLNDAPALKLASSDMWIEKYIWVLFYNVPTEPKKCLFHFGGTATTTLWLREVLFIAVRWESMAVGSQFTLTAE
ncbi:hypothetical protein GN244_ATG18998 [Phytophthora infestans]|uniref:BZIP domain-containing protein n=1 Tax=Phytophthora infestans TaxID=4787 RepID=A0A833W5F9_PHYIN|nr:hypothetical protein GN244_ATG18998 [Phytophthora infestans]KAF4136369.1 hypothetical protein GN958_ATG14430 [Phytophthora infestans]